MSQPYIEANERSIWGEDFGEEFHNGDPNAGVFELPGYSDKRRQMEDKIARGEPVDPLPYRFQYVRCMNGAGQPDRRKIAEWKQQGYELVDGIEGARALGLDIDGTTHDETPDGHVQSGDQVLMFCSRQRAAYNHAKNRAAVNADSEARFHTLQERARQVGAEVKITEEVVTDKSAADKSKRTLFTE